MFLKGRDSPSYVTRVGRGGQDCDSDDGDDDDDDDNNGL